MEQMQELVQAQQFGPLPVDAMPAIAERVNLWLSTERATLTQRKAE